MGKCRPVRNAGRDPFSFFGLTDDPSRILLLMLFYYKFLQMGGFSALPPFSKQHAIDGGKSRKRERS